MSLYPNRAHHIYKAPGDPKWKSSRVPLATGLIDAAVSNQCDTFYGAYWADQSRFAVLDIDEDSRYHNTRELQRLRTDLASVGLQGTALFQSSNSTGWHLYIPFHEPAPSKDIEQSLKAYLKVLDYEVIGGQLEVFPSGNALRLPLQAGFAWLDDAGSVALRREDIGQEAAISRFLSELRDYANNWHNAKTQIDSRLKVTAAAAGDDAQDHVKAINGEGFDDLFSSRLIRENYEKGRQYWREGLTGKNQRHDAVICIEHYLWHGDQAAGLPAYPGRFNDHRRYRLIRAWLQENHNGFCNHINAGEWQTVEAQIRRACVWRRDEKTAGQEREPYPLTERAQEVLQARSMATGRTWTIDDLKKGNEGRERKARKKIMRAVTTCLSEGRQISRKTLQLMTGCSPNTLRRHADLWKLLAAGSGDKNPGVQGGLSVLPGHLSLEVVAERDFLNQELPPDSVDIGLDRQEQVCEFSEAVSKKLEIVKLQAERAFQARCIHDIAIGHLSGNCQNIEGLADFSNEKSAFILPYGAARRPGSASVPLRRLAPREVLAAAQRGLKQCRRHNDAAESKNVAYRGSQTGQVSDRSLKPTEENNSASRLVYRLVIDAGGKI